MYWNTREYVNNKIVRPVLNRAGSVKQISSQAANAAVDRLDGALTVADEYIDHYLPGDPGDKVAEGKQQPQNQPSLKNKSSLQSELFFLRLFFSKYYIFFLY